MRVHRFTCLRRRRRQVNLWTLVLLFFPNINGNSHNRPAGNDAELIFVNQAVSKIQGADKDKKYQEESFHILVGRKKRRSEFRKT